MEANLAKGKNKPCPDRPCKTCHGSGHISICSENHVGCLPCPTCGGVPYLDKLATIQTPPMAGKSKEISEKQLQKEISQLLNLRGIWFAWSRTDRPTHNIKGTPDFIFSIGGKSLAMECKVGNNDLSDDQKYVRAKMESNGWTYQVIYTTAEAFEFLKQHGVQ